MVTPKTNELLLTAETLIESYADIEGLTIPEAVADFVVGMQALTVGDLKVVISYLEEVYWEVANAE